MINHRWSSRGDKKKEVAVADAEVTGARGTEEVSEEEAAADTSFINKKRQIYIHDCKCLMKDAYLKLSIIVKKTT